MAVLLTQTRQAIRADIGYNLGAVYEGTMTAAGSTTTGVDTNLKISDDLYNEMQIVFTSGTNDGEVRYITNYVGSSGTFTIRGDAVSATADGDTYEIWDRDIPVARVHSFINRAVRAVPRKASPPLTEVGTHSSRELKLYDISTAMVGIEEIWYRTGHDYIDLDNCDSVWSELVDGDVTLTQDIEDKREGSASLVLEIATGLGAGDIAAAQSVGIEDLRGMTHVEGWIWTDTALSAANLQLILSATASAGAETELLSIPAINARTWTRFSVALANPEDDGAIVSIGLKYSTDIGAATVKLDGIVATQEDSESWKRLHWNFWGVDRDQRKFRLRDEGAAEVGHSLLKLVGRKKPNLLNADATECDIEPEYIITKASALALHARADRSAERRKAAAIDAERYDIQAELAKRKIQGPQQIRWVDN
mgnify:FL=1